METREHFHKGSPDLRVEVASPGGPALDTVLVQEHPKILAADPGAGDMTMSYDLALSADVIQPGLEVALTFDPDDRMEGVHGTETVGLQVESMPPLSLTVVPTLGDKIPGDVRQWANDLDEDHHDIFVVKTLMPVSTLDLRIREPYETDANLRRTAGWVRWLEEMLALWGTESGAWQDYYFGAVLPFNGSPVGGVGYVGGTASVGFAVGDVFTHELGHNLSLRHAPCGGAGSTDRNYPHRDGRIANWGFNAETGKLVSPLVKDVMGYCRPNWISTYHFTKVYEYRKRQTSSPKRGLALMIWGHVTPGGELVLNPMFEVDALLSEQEPDGEYRAVGYGPNGEELFSFPFQPRDLHHADGWKLFNVRVPADNLDLESMTVWGPGMEQTISQSSMDPMGLLYGESGLIRAIVREDVSQTRPTEGVLMISDGIPGGIR